MRLRVVVFVITLIVLILVLYKYKTISDNADDDQDDVEEMAQLMQNKSLFSPPPKIPEPPLPYLCRGYARIEKVGEIKKETDGYKFALTLKGDSKLANCNHTKSFMPYEKTIPNFTKPFSYEAYANNINLIKPHQLVTFELQIRYAPDPKDDEFTTYSTNVIDAKNPTTLGIEKFEYDEAALAKLLNQKIKNEVK